MIETYFTIKTAEMIIFAAAFFAIIAIGAVYKIIESVSYRKKKRAFDERLREIRQEIEQDRGRF